MLNNEIYEALEMEFEKCRMEEDVEEVLMDLSEALADEGILDKEITSTETYGKTKIKAYGICSEEEGEVTVFLNRIEVGKKEFVIEDYFL